MKIVIKHSEVVGRLVDAPILLSEGIITNPKTKEGYGLIHIEARHGKQIRQSRCKCLRIYRGCSKELGGYYGSQKP